MPAPSSMEIVSKLGDLLRRRSSSSIGAAQLEAAHKEHNKDGLTPLHVAVASGSIPVCEELLKAGAPINAYTFRLAFCMHLNGRALTCGHWVKRGKTGKFERLQETDLSTLHLAVSVLIDRCSPCHSNKGVDTSLIRFLIDNGSDVDALDGRGRTALQMAVSGSLYEVVEMLASSSAQIPATALHLATNREDVKMVRLLVKLGANLDARQMNGQGIGWTPLCLAARAGAVDVIRELVASRANVHAISANGKSALEIATINRNEEAVRRCSKFFTSRWYRQCLRSRCATGCQRRRTSILFLLLCHRRCSRRSRPLATHNTDTWAVKMSHCCMPLRPSRSRAAGRGVTAPPSALRQRSHASAASRTSRSTSAPTSFGLIDLQPSLPPSAQWRSESLREREKRHESVKLPGCTGCPMF